MCAVLNEADRCRLLLSGSVLRRVVAVGLVVLAGLVGTPVPAQTETTEPDIDPGSRVEFFRHKAKKLGAKGQLPLAWWALDDKVEAAREQQAGRTVWAELEVEAERLMHKAEFVDRMRQQKSAVEAALGRFDQALAEIATLYGVDLGPTLTGSEAADALLAELTGRNLRRQALVDSLTVQNRYLQETVGARVAAQESLITALQLELSSLRHRLWETELRAGVAEADRSAAETTLTRKQRREEALAQVMKAFTAAEGETRLTAENEVVLSVHGMAFAVGSANLQSGQEALLAKIAGAIERFPDAEIVVEGHTDDTGSRQANLRLSRRRAETVARWLEQELKRPEGSITTKGYGPDRPVALNATPEGRARNRRIDVVLKLAD